MDIAQTVKSIIAKELFHLHPEVKNQRVQFWTNRYYVNIAGQYTNEEIFKDILKNKAMKKMIIKSFIEIN